MRDGVTLQGAGGAWGERNAMRMVRSATYWFAGAGLLALAACAGSSAGGTTPVPRILISTDAATGLIDTHGADGSCSVSFNAASPYMHDGAVAPQDIDDGLTLAMASNLDAQKLAALDSIVPTFGNATLPAEMLVARQIVWDLKGRTDIPIVPGAVAPASQTLHPAAQWFDGSTIPIEGPEGSFAAACRNAGVSFMRERLLASADPMTILALGPLTDVACLLLTAPEVAPKIREIIAVASRVEGESLTINGKVVNDFNFRTDPVAGALLIAANATRDVPIRLMSFQLTGQTSQADDLIFFDSTTLRGPQPPTPESERSLDWLLSAVAPRNQYWSGIFSTPEGPFDQYALAAAVWPHLFDCRDGLAYVQQCPYPAWSPAYPTDAEGNPTESPFNSDDNPCVDHGSANGSALAQVPAQLVVTLNLDDQGPAIRGESGIDGNLPALAAPARPVTVCTDFTDAAARQEFESLLYEHTW